MLYTVMSTTERKLQEISGSFLVSVPKSWARSFHLKKGSKVELATAKNGILSISPRQSKEKTKDKAVIVYDKYFIRNFFRQYFLGFENIVIKFNKKGKQDQIKVYSVLKKFMNVQVLEETEDKIQVKCFKIDELSIRECLNRMHFLLLNTIDELLAENDKVVLKEITANLTRFYYMLVMQVRRFLDEGKFTDQNQISLLHALDCRMVAEKIERVSDLVINFSNIKDKEVKSLLENVRKHYSNSYQRFYNHEYDKAIRLTDDEAPLLVDVEKLTKKFERINSVAKYRQVNDLSLIIKYSRNIAMLTR